MKAVLAPVDGQLITSAVYMTAQYTLNVFMASQWRHTNRQYCPGTGTGTNMSITAQGSCQGDPGLGGGGNRGLIKGDIGIYRGSVIIGR